jgi:hypothetical protein
MTPQGTLLASGEFARLNSRFESVQLNRLWTFATCEFDHSIVASSLLGRTDSFCCEWVALLAWCESVAWGAITMKKTGLLFLILVASSYPAIAKRHYHHRERATISHSRTSCETVRAYVAQVGLAQAKAMAQAAGMTESEERQAVQCLEKKI